MGSELRRQAIYVVLAALAGMLIYIAFRFELIYGVAAVQQFFTIRLLLSVYSRC